MAESAPAAPAPPAPPVKQVKMSVVADPSKKDRIKNAKRRSRKSVMLPKGPETLSRFVTVLMRDSQQRALRQVARALVKPGLGILAADDSVRQIDAHLKEFKLPTIEQSRRKYHEVLLNGDHELRMYLSGVLLREESLGLAISRSKKLTRMVKDQGIKLGIRMDKGVVSLAGTFDEYTTFGLDKLEALCKQVKEKGAEFALWRCVYRISEFAPSRQAIIENSNTLARFAVVCQSAGMVPIVSPEVLQEGNHGHVEAQEALREILAGLVKALIDQHVYLEGTLIRVTAAAPGPCYRGPQDITSVARGTAKVINQCLPPAIGGVFLAREHNLARSLAILNDLQTCPIKKPFFTTFCFSQVIQSSVTSVWAGQDKNLVKARAELMRRLKCCSFACFGQFSKAEGSFFVDIRLTQ